nr:hypothetical protein [Halobiforma nitratireducens]
MVTTHVLVGLVVALPVVFLAPDHAPAALAAGLVGGLFPDLDVVATHRKTLHHPVVAAFGAAAAVPLAVVVPTDATIALVTFLAAAALHCVGDLASCGIGARPWTNPPSNRAVYDHVRGQWVPPRRWVRYDGSPEDLAFASALAVPLLAVLEGPWTILVALLIAVSVGYTVTRKRLEDLARWGVRYLPPRLHVYVPDRYLA